MAGDSVIFNNVTPIRRRQPILPFDLLNIQQNASYISLKVNSKSHIDIDLLDISGRKTELLFKGTPGANNLKFKCSWAPGVHFEYKSCIVCNLSRNTSSHAPMYAILSSHHDEWVTLTPPSQPQ